MCVASIESMLQKLGRPIELAQVSYFIDTSDVVLET